ncbi:MAG: MBL fold metallo-hydrolase [Rhodobiaceae bacterium]|nr:MBL fold metallo-hydrolase [Rhodobiaceae bacterium]MCC0057314.1 MBL fold metallo-hydrolase [Rhodobiaceae bacterium]
MNSPHKPADPPYAPTEIQFAMEVPEFGELAEIEPGLMMSRMPHPKQPHEVNIFFVEDEGGWALIDTGCGEESKATWDTLLAGPLSDVTITRIIATHFHADHVGLAGWLAERLGAPVFATRDCEKSLAFDNRPYTADELDWVRRFCRMHGYGEGASRSLLTQPEEFYADVYPLPEDLNYLPLSGQLNFARHSFDIMPFSGHAPNLVTLRETSGRIYMACDQVMGALSPVLFVNVVEPEYDAASDYLHSLDVIEREIRADALTLPGHFAPFTGLHEAVRKARDRQNRRRDRVLEACRQGDLQLSDVSAVLYGRKPDGYEAWFFVSEALTNVNRLIGEGALAWDERGSDRFLKAL